MQRGVRDIRRTNATPESTYEFTPFGTATKSCRCLREDVSICSRHNQGIHIGDFEPVVVHEQTGDEFTPHFNQPLFLDPVLVHRESHNSPEE